MNNIKYDLLDDIKKLEIFLEVYKELIDDSNDVDELLFILDNLNVKLDIKLSDFLIYQKQLRNVIK